MDILIEEMIRERILLNDAKREFEKMYIEKVLNYYKNNKSKAAEFLGMHRNTLQGKVKNLKIKTSK
jgi:DNA-binding NtrC family response regulator